MKILKKIIFGLIALAVVLHLGILGTQTFISWVSNQKSEDQEEKSRKRNLEERQTQYYENILKGYQEKGKIVEWDEKGYMGIRGIDEAPNTMETGKEAVLIYTEEQKKHLIRIIEDIDYWLNNADEDNNHFLDINVEGERDKKDQYRNYLLRNNCILYGAPGTGKTEFIKELNRILINRYGKLSQDSIQEDNIDNPNNGYLPLGEEDQKSHEPLIPVFEIKGIDIMSTGKDEPKVYEKLILCIKKLKNDFFKMPDWEGNIGEYSKLPYILFIEEADQAKNPLTYSPDKKNNLEELKNFFSTSGDSKGLLANSQDPNSICIIATNNYDTIDPAMKRRGRLGKSINFTWNPATLKKYSEAINWPKIFGQDHYCWKFKDNDDYHELLKLAEQMNFDNVSEKFIPKTREILSIWDDWGEEERNDFAKSRLGIENRVWCEYCNHETNPEKPSQKQKRFKNALEGVKESEEREKIFEEEEKKKLATCSKFNEEHDAKPISNWLLHYIYTFFEFNKSQNLEDFTHPNQIQRYAYTDARLLRERIQQLTREIYDCNNDLINTYGKELRNLSNQMKTDNSTSSFELAAIKDTLQNIEEQIKVYINAKINS